MQGKKEKETYEITEDESYETSEQEVVEDFLDDVTAGIKRQITSDKSESEEQNENEEDRELSVSNQAGLKKHKKLYIGISIAVGVVLVLTVGIIGFVKSKAGKQAAVNIIGDVIYDNVDYEKSNKESLKDSVVVEPEKEQEEKMINVALIGNQDGNTDSMMVATIDSEHKKLKLTSIMRDIYVEIPGHQNAKLNAAYQLGGIDLFYETMKHNFEATFDGYVLVDYSTFEYIIDRIGGVEVDLTPTEARFLRTSNYIADPSNRNVESGRHSLNGGQALGYCRIRYKPTANNEHDDFGRTARQRAVIQQVYKQLMSKNPVDLVSIMNDCLQNANIKTDITKEEMKTYMNTVLDLNSRELDTYRIPSDKSFTFDDRRIGRRDQSVIILNDWEASKKELHGILYQEADSLN